MSKHINVNPGHYKVAGRERQGEEVVHERPDEQTNEPHRRNAEKQNFIPGAAPVGEHDPKNDLRSRPEWDEPRQAAPREEAAVEEEKSEGGLFSRIMSRFSRD